MESGWKSEYGKALHDFEDSLRRLAPSREVKQRREYDRGLRQEFARERARAEALGRGQKIEDIAPMPKNIQERARSFFVGELAASQKHPDFYRSGWGSLLDYDEATFTRNREEAWDALMPENIWG